MCPGQTWHERRVNREIKDALERLTGAQQGARPPDPERLCQLAQLTGVVGRLAVKSTARVPSSGQKQSVAPLRSVVQPGFTSSVTSSFIQAVGMGCIPLMC